MKNLKDIGYIIGIVLAGLSSFLIDKTQLENNQNTLENKIANLNTEVVDLKTELKQTNLGVVVYRLSNLEKGQIEANNKILEIDKKTDRILIMFANHN